MLRGSDVQNSINVHECVFSLIGGDTVAIYFHMRHCGYK